VAKTIAIGTIAAAALALGCGALAEARPALAAVGTGSAADQNALNGTYRVAITDADLRAGGVSARYIRTNHGTFIWVLDNGRWRFSQHADSKVFTVPWALYTIRGGRVTFVFRVPGAPRGAPPPLTFRWKLAGGQLRFTLVGGKDPLKIVPVIFTAHRWKKIA